MFTLLACLSIVFASAADRSSEVISNPLTAASEEILHSQNTMLSPSLIGSFTAFEDFQRSFDLQLLFLTRPDLFTDSEGIGLFETLRVAIRAESRSQAIKFFIDHNKPEIDTALRRILRFTNDLTVATLMSNQPFLVTPEMIWPITILVADFVATAVREPCLLQQLPSFFALPDNYAMMFTPIDRQVYKVSRNVQPGVIGILHDEQEALPWKLDTLTSWDEKIVHIEMSHKMAPKLNYTRFIDLQCGCAVQLKFRFKQAGIFPQFRMFAAVDTLSDELVIWRGDESIRIHVGKNKVHWAVSADREHVQFTVDGSIHLVPTRQSPFSVTVWERDEPDNHAMYPLRYPRSLVGASRGLSSDCVMLPDRATATRIFGYDVDANNGLV